jgi:hypothetical protein
MSDSGSSIAERHHALLRLMKTGACNCMPLTFDPVASHHAEDCRYRLLAEIHAALETADEFEGLTDRLTSLLDGVCIAFKGPHPPNGRHSWHDLPEIAASMMGELHQLRELTTETVSDVEKARKKMLRSLRDTALYIGDNAGAVTRALVKRGFVENEADASDALRMVALVMGLASASVSSAFVVDAKGSKH